VANQSLADFFSPGPDLELVAVVGRGVPNEERVCLKVRRRVNLTGYLLIVGVSIQERDVLPLNDHLMWFGSRIVEAGSWVLIYTGAGTELVTFMRDTKAPVLALHWGKQFTVFQNNDVVPCLLRLDYDPGGIQVGRIGS
jgi:hypothetical protein